MEIAVALLVGCAAFFAVRAIGSPRHGRAVQRLDRVAGGHAGDGIDGEGATVWERVAAPLLRGALQYATGILPARVVAHFEAELAVAGRPVGVAAFTVACVGVPIMLVGVTALAVLSGGQGISRVALLAIVAMGMLGIAAPQIWLKGRITRRQQQMARELPDAFDLIVVSVEAGLGLEAAMARVADMAGELHGEMRRALADMNLGLSRRQALQQMAARVRLAPLRVLVSAILQADRTGMSVGAVLRAQAAHLRTQRRQHAEERAMQAPLKMLFPLVFFIFPSLFVVVLGPGILTLLDTLGN